MLCCAPVFVKSTTDVPQRLLHQAEVGASSGSQRHCMCRGMALKTTGVSLLLKLSPQTSKVTSLIHERRNPNDATWLPSAIE